MNAETLTTHQRFTDDMEDAGYEIEHYHGRFRWHGPAVRVSNQHDVIRLTATSIQWDQLGRGWIVYPVEPEPDREGCIR